ncbi:MAG: hypothetical protein N2C14_04790, partial [Planctomycetales bacterium]
LLSESPTIRYEEDQEEEFLIQNLRTRWERHYETEWRPSKEQRIGVLRSILGSIETMRAPGPRSQAWLRHIEGFLTKKLGVSVQAYSEDMEPLPEPDEEEELLRLGRQWASGERETAKAEFQELMQKLTKDRQVERILHVCHHLLGEESDPESPISVDLTRLIPLLRHSLTTQMG